MTAPKVVEGDRIEFDFLNTDGTLTHIIGIVDRLGMADWLDPEVPFYDVTVEGTRKTSRAWHVDQVVLSPKPTLGFETITVEQQAFDFDALMGITPPVKVKEFYSCGIHEMRVEVAAHWEVCRKLTCPRCGELSSNAYLADLNHSLIEWRAFCGKQLTLLNHAHRARLILDGKWKHTPQSNCYGGHDHSDRKSGAYFSKGAPMECVQAEFDKLRTWLLDHHIPEHVIGVAA